MTGPALGSCLYFGRVMHKRLRPFTHRFSYRVFSLFVDLDELGELDRRLTLFSHNRFNMFSFHDRDHGARGGKPLRPWIEDQLAHAGVDIAGGPLLLLCFPRVLGYVFNPLSVWFCYHPLRGLQAMLYEVSNTFGETHAYVIPVEPGGAADEPIVQRCSKQFHVSPFLPMEAGYRFRLRVPDERLSILIRQHLREGEVLLATLTGRRADLDGARLLYAALAYPLMTLKVIAAIHWQALRLWLKGAKPQPRPAALNRRIPGSDPSFPQAAE